VTAKTATTVTLSWTAATDNVGVTGYQILRNGTAVATASGTPYTVTGLTSATAYTFTVVARDAAGNTSGASNAVNVTTATTSSAIALRSRANGRYVSAATGSALIANGTSVGAGQQFERVDLGNGNVALRAKINNMYVCADGGGAQPLIANRAAVGGWETFQLITNPNGSVSLRAQANAQYVCADGGGAQPLIANRTAIGPWEQFDLVAG
jgi:hypothetical protein